ncbi:hypothetical protein [Aliarcobacter butzleri]|uniref:hypothetical protein n=1 Tax=Aliarcobacter butzleri TaxID=28197 RepID=UPI003AF4D75E
MNYLEKREIVFLYITKEFTKFILTGIIFIFITGFIDEIFIYLYGLEEYLKKDILRLFVDDYYLRNASTYINNIDEYFNQIKYNFHNKYLFIIPYSISMIYLYISYFFAHKIVDRSGIGATKRLNFWSFFIIFGISNALARIDVFSYLLIFWWYLFYKTIKISVLKIEKKLKKEL